MKYWRIFKGLFNKNVCYENFQEEALRVEGEMTKIQHHEVKREKESGEKILRETVEKVKAIKDKEREEAVAKARQEEVTKARLAAEEISG